MGSASMTALSVRGENTVSIQAEGYKDKTIVFLKGGAIPIHLYRSRTAMAERQNQAAIQLIKRL